MTFPQRVVLATIAGGAVIVAALISVSPNFLTSGADEQQPVEIEAIEEDVIAEEDAPAVDSEGLTITGSGNIVIGNESDGNTITQSVSQ